MTTQAGNLQLNQPAEGDTNWAAEVNNNWAALGNAYLLSCGRLTLTTGTPVPTSDVTGATTLYFTHYKGNLIALYDGSSKWEIFEFTERSISLSGKTANTNYDVFIYDSSGTLTLELVAWANGTTRAAALVTQDGVYVKSGATARRYLGTIRITGTTGQSEDSDSKRFVWNYYNRVTRPLYVNNVYYHTYTDTSNLRAWNNDTSNKLEYVVGVEEDATTWSIVGDYNRAAGTNLVGMGVDTYTSCTTRLGYNGGQVAAQNYAGGNGHIFNGIGYHAVYAVERGNGAFTAFDMNGAVIG